MLYVFSFESDAEVDYRSEDLDAFTKELLGDSRDHGQGDRSDNLEIERKALPQVTESFA